MAKYFERPSEETQLFISPSIYAIDHSDIFPTIDTVAYGAIGSSDHHQRDQSSDLSARDYHRPTSRRFQLSYAQICCMLLNFLCEMFDIITIVPIIMMLEESVCRSYYLEHDPGAIADDGSIATHLCKIAPIQSSLASIRGWKALLEILPVLFVALPFGALADGFGRKKVLAISVAGLTLGLLWTIIVCTFDNVFDVKLVLLSAVFHALGGDIFITDAMIYSLAADSSSEEDRGRTFYLVYSTYLFVELIAPAIVSSFADISVFIPLGIGTTSLLLALPLMYIMPNVQRQKKSASRISAHSDEAGDGDNLSSQNEFSVRTISHDLLIVFKNRNIVLSIPIFLAATLRPAVLNTLLQYSSVRFGWSVSQAAIFISEVAIVNIVLFMVLLPTTVWMLRSRFDLRPQKIDLAIVRISLFILCIGAIGIGLAPEKKSLISFTAIFAVGYGARISMLSLLTSWVSADVRSRLYGLVQMVETIGFLCGEPLLLNVFSIILRADVDKKLYGLPFWITGVVFLLACISSLGMRLRSPRQSNL